MRVAICIVRILNLILLHTCQPPVKWLPRTREQVHSGIGGIAVPAMLHHGSFSSCPRRRRLPHLQPPTSRLSGFSAMHFPLS